MKKGISIILVCLFVLMGSMALANPLEKLIGFEVTIYWVKFQANRVYIVDIVDENWFIYKYGSSSSRYLWGYVPNIITIKIHDKNYQYFQGETSPW